MNVWSEFDKDRAGAGAVDPGDGHQQMNLVSIDYILTADENHPETRQEYKLGLSS